MDFMTLKTIHFMSSSAAKNNFFRYFKNLNLHHLSFLDKNRVKDNDFSKY